MLSRMVSSLCRKTMAPSRRLFHPLAGQNFHAIQNEWQRPSANLVPIVIEQTVRILEAYLDAC